MVFSLLGRDENVSISHARANPVKPEALPRSSANVKGLEDKDSWGLECTPAWNDAAGLAATCWGCGDWEQPTSSASSIESLAATRTLLPPRSLFVAENQEMLCLSPCCIVQPVGDSRDITLVPTLARSHGLTSILRAVSAAFLCALCD